MQARPSWSRLFFFQGKNMTEKTTLPETVTLTLAQLDEIAERGAHKALEKMTANIFIFVGRGIVTRAFWFIGVLFIGAYFWLQSRGFIK